ncbi:hypothetical protein ACH4TW_27260 [Streptomyces olivaceus]|uniref:hypothetical protein n=2 Tax=Streptomyces olivaceus TaxID=47716 RepID=UPI0037AC5582
MVDPGGTSRALMGVYKGAVFGKRTLTWRRWFKHLIFQSVLRALLMEQPDVETQRIREAAQKLCTVLGQTVVPMEPSGFFAKIGSWFRRHITRGVRFPDYRGPLRETYQHRLYLWAELAARSQPGREALRYAQFPDVEDSPALFAQRFRAAVAEVLSNPAEPLGEAENHARYQMLLSIEIGLTEQQRHDRRRGRNLTLQMVGAAGASAALSQFGFNNDWQQTVGLSVAGAGTAAVYDVTAGALRGVTREMTAARRQALAWLRVIVRILLRWRGDGVPQREVDEDWKEYLPRALTVLVARDAENLLMMLREFNAVDRLDKLIETAQRARDEDLSSLLTDLETTLHYDDLRYFPDAVKNLLHLIGDVTPRPGGYAQPEIVPGDPPGIPPGASVLP